MSTLDLGLVGNCTISALIDGAGCVQWACFPRFDGDPVFCRLLEPKADRGYWAIDLEGHARSEQRYLDDTAVLVTELRDESGSGVEITDFAPRFRRFGRSFRPTALVRVLRPLGERPRIRVRLRPATDWGRAAPHLTRGSNHVRFVVDGNTLRLTTNAPVAYILDETPFLLDHTVVMILGPDESLTAPVLETGREFLEQTTDYWKRLAGRLAVPFEWQEAVIRSAITLKLCSFEETGAIVAAVTTSIPEAADTGRNWDYRYCWLRDAFFVVRALNRLGYVETMESYVTWLENVVAGSADGRLQPVYGVGLERRLTERAEDALTGYRGMGPVRVGNQAFEHVQHDAYGSVVLAVTQAFFDRRLSRPAGPQTFHQLERLGEHAFALHATPDAGLWELREREAVHTHSAVMCWAACDRLARIAAHLRLSKRAETWRARAEGIRETVLKRAFRPELNSFVATFEGEHVDASLLLLHEVGFLSADDPRYTGTVAAIEKTLRKGAHLFRYAVEDDFGLPQNAFIICTFWYIDALIAQGRREEARELFETLLAARNPLGLLSEDIDVTTGALWGNFPQTYSHVGLINCAMKLSRSWDDVV